MHFFKLKVTCQREKLITKLYLILHNIFQQFLLFRISCNDRKEHFNFQTAMHTNQKEAHITFSMLSCPLQMDYIFRFPSSHSAMWGQQKEKSFIIPCEVFALYVNSSPFGCRHLRQIFLPKNHLSFRYENRNWNLVCSL